jgi:hypothetical protein
MNFLAMSHDGTDNNFDCPDLQLKIGWQRGTRLAYIESPLL